MLECNRYIHKKMTRFIRIVALVLPILCAALLMSQVAFAKTTYHISDGDRVFVHTTYETDPAEVLIEAGVQLGKDDIYTTLAGNGISQITVQRKQKVHIICGEETITVSTFGGTVAELLDRCGIVLTDRNDISVELEAKTFDGMEITISTTLNLEETYTVNTPFDVFYSHDPSLGKDEQKVLVSGVEGQIQKVDTVTYFNGQEILRENISSAVLSQPVAQVIAVGSVEGIPQEKLLQNRTEEEIRGVASYLTGNGKLYITDGLIITAKGEILTYKNTMQVKATAYTHTDPGCNMITATGTTVRVGTVAVDPKIIPYGTRMFIITNDGTYVYGIAVAEDCGSAIKQNRVDLYFPTDAECWQFGIRQATIYFLGE